MGMDGEVGILRKGAWADLVGWRLEAKTLGAVLEQLVEGHSSASVAFVGGRRRLIESRVDLP